MWMTSCLLCAITFPQPKPEDISAILHLLPAVSVPISEAQGEPWREISGPHLSARIQLMTPEYGIVNLVLAWRAGAVQVQARTGTMFRVAKRNGIWGLVDRE
jgi:hypothetical protein